MRAEEEIREQLHLSYQHLREIETYHYRYPVGACNWRITKARIETLQWCLGEE